MTLDDKKTQVYRLIMLGMSKDEAELLATMSVEEQEALTIDAEYQGRCKLQTLIKEKELLESLDDIVSDNALKGTSTEIRWLLERLNPKRWGKTVNVNDAPGEGAAMKVPDISKLTDEERDTLLLAVTKII